MGSYARRVGRGMLKFTRGEDHCVLHTGLACATEESRRHTETSRKTSFSSGVPPVPLLRTKMK